MTRICMYVRFATYHSHSGGRRRFILLLLTGRSLLFQISAHRSHVHVHIQIDRGFRSNANRYGDRSACEEALPASRNLISANGGAPVCEEQLPFFRNGTTFRNIRSANLAFASACVRRNDDDSDSILYIATVHTIDTTADLSRLVWSREQMLRFTMTNRFADARASDRIDESRVRTHHGI